MTPDAAVAAAERTEAAIRLIEQAGHSDFVELVTVSALELCVLGGPRHPLFEEPVAHAWLQMGSHRRKRLTGWVTEGMVERGLLIEGDAGFSPVRKGAAYSLKPALGIALAARCRPAFIITVTSDPSRRAPRFFALGDQDHPLRGVVAEEPAALPPDIAGDYPHVKKFGPLGRMYRHVLLSPQKAAEALAQVAISPPPQPPAAGQAPGRTVPLYRQYDGRNPDRLSAHRPRRRHQGASGQPRSRRRGNGRVRLRRARRGHADPDHRAGTMSARPPERPGSYREAHSALNWPMLTCGLFGPAAAVAICVVLGITVSPQWYPWILFILFGLFLVPISLLNRNWPTGIRIDESGISIGAIGSAQAVLRRPTVNHQSRGLYTCPWSGVQRVRLVTDRAELRQMRNSPSYYTLTNRWGGKAGMTHCNIGVLASPFMRAALVIEVNPATVTAAEIRPARYYSNFKDGHFSHLIHPQLSSTWVVPTRHPDALSAALQRVPGDRDVANGL